jgi:hypothetical protein
MNHHPDLPKLLKKKKIPTIEKFFGIEEAWNFLAENHEQSHGEKQI